MSEYVGPNNDPDRYTLVELRSRGGEGKLYRAFITIDGVAVEVAVKVIHQDSIPDFEQWQARWQRQAELLRSLDHPGLVKVREVFDGPLPHPEGGANPSSRTLYLVMNWASGINLEDWVASRPDRTFAESMGALGSIAAAVDYLHGGPVSGRQIVHRDIKPANVMIDGDTARLVDFGFARVQGGTDHTFAGTPFYMAPEVIAGQAHDAAADNFGFGATAYYAATGQPPAMNDYNGMLARVQALPGVDGRPGIAERFLTMLHPNAARRPASTVDWLGSLSGGHAMTRSTVARPRPVLAGPGAFPLKGSESGPAAQAGTPAAVPSDPLDDFDDDDEEEERKGSTAVVIGIIVGLAILLLGGVAFAASRSGKSHSGRPSAGAAPATTTTTTPPGIVPNVVGLDVNVAKVLLKDAGVKNVLVTERADSQPRDVVLDQTPAAGVPVAGAVRLVTSRGSPTAASTSTTPDGPTTTVPPPTLYLFDLQPVAGNGGDPVAANIGGPRFPRSVEQSFCESCSDSKSEYDIGRHYARFKADVGVDDNTSDSTARATFELWAVGDGGDRLLWSSKPSASGGAGLGTKMTVDVSVKNVLRVRLVTRSETGSGKGAWGDARVQT